MAKQSRPRRHGQCALTREEGPFVRSHIIPEALTRPEEPGQQFVQGGIGIKPIWRRTSWYDPRLVTRAGENILSKVDNAGIAELRRHRLVWSSWGPFQRAPDVRPVGTEGHGLRTVSGINSHCLRLFFLSLLWRSAACSLPEFEEISLSEHELEILRDALLNSTPPPYQIFPVMLVQLSTLGPQHNNTAVYERKIYPSIDGVTAEEEVPLFRFYFDGLVVHIHHSTDCTPRIGNTADLCVGGSDTLHITTIEYGQSAQAERLQAVMNEAAKYGWFNGTDSSKR